MLEQVALHTLDLFIPPHFHFLIMARKPRDCDVSHTLLKLGEERTQTFKKHPLSCFANWQTRQEAPPYSPHMLLRILNVYDTSHSAALTVFLARSPYIQLEIPSSDLERRQNISDLHNKQLIAASSESFPNFFHLPSITQIKHSHKQRKCQMMHNPKRTAGDAEAEQTALQTICHPTVPTRCSVNMLRDGALCRNTNPVPMALPCSQHCTGQWSLSQLTDSPQTAKTGKTASN